MMYKSFLPSPMLSEFVRNYTIIHLQFDALRPVPSKHRSPKAEQKIVFYLKGLPTFHNAATGNSQSPPPVAVLSHQSDQKTIKLTSDFFAFIIFLHPGALHRLIHMPMMELIDQPVDAELFFGTGVRSVSERLAAAASSANMIAIAEEFLLLQCTQAGIPNSIDKIASHLLNDPASFSLHRVAQQACLGKKQFYRKFTERIGISPKLFSRLSRFNHTYRYKINHPNISWSSIAQDFCYTDYHHLEKEFKEFTGLTPQHWTQTHLTAPERILRLR